MHIPIIKSQDKGVNKKCMERGECAGKDTQPQSKQRILAEGYLGDLLATKTPRSQGCVSLTRKPIEPMRLKRKKKKKIAALRSR
jgi:hypothetical protein